MRALIPAVVLLLAACSGEAEQTGERASGEKVAAPEATGSPPAESQANDARPTAAVREAAGILVDGQGLRQVEAANGVMTLLAFGTPRATVDRIAGEALDRAPDTSLSQECGAGAMAFSQFGALTLNYMDGRFVGWYLDGRNGSSLATASGVGIGTARARVMDLVKPQLIEDSTLGDEFYSEPQGLGGFFENGKVASLYAGTNCFFR